MTPWHVARPAMRLRREGGARAGRAHGPLAAIAGMASLTQSLSQTVVSTARVAGRIGLPWLR